jgi:hypothetical protein
MNAVGVGTQRSDRCIAGAAVIFIAADRGTVLILRFEFLLGVDVPFVQTLPGLKPSVYAWVQAVRIAAIKSGLRASVVVVALTGVPAGYLRGREAGVLFFRSVARATPANDVVQAFSVIVGRFRNRGGRIAIEGGRVAFALATLGIPGLARRAPLRIALAPAFFPCAADAFAFAGFWVDPRSNASNFTICYFRAKALAP